MVKIADSVKGERFLSTSATTVGEVVEESGIKLSPGDVIYPDPSTRTVDVKTIEVSRAISNIVVDNGKQVVVNTGLKDNKDIVALTGNKLHPEDEVSMDVASSIVNDDVLGRKLLIKRAKLVKFKLNGVDFEVRTQANTVAELLADKKIELGDGDKLSIDKNTRLTDGINFSISRTVSNEEEVKEVITKETVIKYDSTLDAGTEKVQTEGEDGERLARYRIVKTDNVEVSRELISSEVLKQATSKVIIKGSKVAQSVAKSYSGSIEYWRPYIESAAAIYGADANQLMRVMACESGGNALASNPSGASGLFQFMPSTYYGNGGVNIWDGAEQSMIAAKMFANGQAYQWVCK